MTAPDDHGFLDVGDGHRIYWEVHGNPLGKPAVVLHGGPGSGCAPWALELFDLTDYRVVLFDQRGCGRSRPYAGEPTVDLSANTTHHLVRDVERLRRHLAISRWLVLGGSWGSTLALAYAQAHPGAVSEMVLFSVVTTTRPEVAWVTREVGRLLPEEWQRFREAVPDTEREGDLAAAYNRLLLDPDPVVHERAAREWCLWEDAHTRLGAGGQPDSRYEDPSFRLCFSRIVTHFWSNAAWLADDALLLGMPRLAGIPAVLVHGRRDISSPVDTAWRLARAWPSSKLVLLDDAGHGASAETIKVLRAATAQMRKATPPTANLTTPQNSGE